MAGGAVFPHGVVGDLCAAHGADALPLEPLHDARLAEDVRALQQRGARELVVADGALAPTALQLTLAGGRAVALPKKGKLVNKMEGNICQV